MDWRRQRAGVDGSGCGRIARLRWRCRDCARRPRTWRQRPDASHTPTNSLLRIEHDEKPRSAASAGLRPTEARRNYLPELPYFRETKTYHSQPLESTRHAGSYFVPISVRPVFIFVAEVMSNYLTTDGLKKFSLLLEAP